MATQDPNDHLADQAKSINGAIEKFLSRTVAKLALDIHANLVRAPSEGGTPVDTGWARANWIPRIKEPVTEPVGSRPKTRVDINALAAGDYANRTLTTGKVSDAEQKAGVASLGGYRIDMGDVYVSNAVPYIGKLNAGSSKQAPAGFVEASITKALVEDIHR